jgi:predicted GIY-YIG superfamily endonuclease
MKEYNGLVNLDYPENPYSTYILYSEDIKDKSVYIGITEDFMGRAWTHSRDTRKGKMSHYPIYVWMNDVIKIQKKKVLFRVLEKEKYKNIEEARIREKELILEYLKNGYNVLNIQGNVKRFTTRKGVKFSEIRKEYLSKVQKEKYKKGYENPNSKKVYKYDNDYNLIKTYSSAMEAERIEGYSHEAIGKWCNNIRKPRNGYMWSYVKKDNSIINNINLN